MQLYHPGFCKSSPNGFLQLAYSCHNEFSPIQPTMPSIPIALLFQHRCCCAFSTAPRSMNSAPSLLCLVFYIPPPSLFCNRRQLAALKTSWSTIRWMLSLHVGALRWTRCRSSLSFSTCAKFLGCISPFQSSKNRKVKKTESQVRGYLLKPKQNPLGFQSKPRSSGRQRSHGCWDAVLWSWCCMLTLSKKRACAWHGLALVEEMVLKVAMLGMRRDYLGHIGADKLDRDPLPWSHRIV